MYDIYNSKIAIVGKFRKKFRSCNRATSVVGTIQQIYLGKIIIKRVRDSERP